MTRSYSASDVVRLRGSMQIEYTLAERGAMRLWRLLRSEPYVSALGALTGNQAAQMAQAGLKAVYVSGWQVAADANNAGQMYPDQSLYPADSAPALVRRINQAFARADQICHYEGRTDANSATLLTSDIDERDRAFLTGERAIEGFYRVTGGLDQAIARGLAYAPYADLIWCETSEPDLDEAREFAEAIHAEFPGKLMAYNCSLSFNWKKKLNAETIARFQPELARMGYKFQFVTLAGFHTLNFSMFELARDYCENGMAAYARLQEAEFTAEAERGYRAVKHQAFVGAGYFDAIAQTISGGASSTTALTGSTEEAQFCG